MEAFRISGTEENACRVEAKVKYTLICKIFVVKN